MRAGQLDQRITFQARPTTKSATGADIPGAPVEFATVWARVRVSNSQRPQQEYQAADHLITKTKYDFTIRYLPGVTEQMEIVWNGRTFNILSAPDQGVRVPVMVIQAEEQR